MQKWYWGRKFLVMQFLLIWILAVYMVYGGSMTQITVSQHSLFG